MSMAACTVWQAVAGVMQSELFPKGSTNQSAARADDAPPRRAERATTIRQTWRMPNLLPTMMPCLVGSPQLPRQRAEYGIADPLLPAARRLPGSDSRARPALLTHAVNCQSHQAVSTSQRKL